MIRRIRILVSGRVQGVCFRAATQQQAAKLLCNGLVRNLPDGQVEIVAEGSDDLLQKMVEWSHKGSFMAKVEKVVVEDIEIIEPLSGFEIR
jgi:acylphosphatase